VATRADDHQGIRVTEIERSVRFYADAFGAEAVTRPFPIEGDFPEQMFEGPPGVAFRLCHLRFESGMVELFEFTSPREESAPVHPSQANIMHLGFVVDDVEATAERVLAAGGRQVFPITEWGEHRLTYVTDPDGNVIEIADAPLEQLLVGTIAQFPEADPRKGATDG
jgi:catechol 2,3-dioxygenase-like lactoylglutathione lyase family enzyme